MAGSSRFVPDQEEMAALHEVMLTTSRWLFLVGCTAVSIMVARISSFTLGDLLLLASAGLIALTPPSSWWPATPRVGLYQVCLVLLVLGAWLATMVSPNPANSILVLVRLLILAVIVPWAMRILFPTTRSLAAPAVALGIGAALNGLATIAQMAFGVNIPGSQVSNANRYAGLTANVSDTGAICGMGVVIGFGLLGRGPWARRDAFPGAIMVFSLIGAILSGSVSGMISAVLGCAFVIGMHGVSRKKTRTALIALVVGGAIGTWLISMTSNGLSPFDRLKQVLGLSQSQYADTNTSASRMVTIARGWTSFAHHPFTGIGLDISSSNVYDNLPVHNLPVALLHVGGIFFATGVLGLVVAQVVPILRLRQRSSMAAMVLSLMVAVTWFAMTAPGYYNRYFWMPVALAASAGAAAVKEARRASDGDSQAVLQGA